MKAVIRHITHNNSNGAPRWFTIADSAILYSPRPYFLPDWLNEPRLTPALTLRISRLGKNIEPRFASRYYDAVALALLPASGDILPSGNALNDNADGALILGSMLPLAETGTTLRITAARNSDTWLDTTLGDWQHDAHNAIATVSQTITWKTGDLLCLTLPCATPIAVNNRIQAEINNRNTIYTNIK